MSSDMTEVICCLVYIKIILSGYASIHLIIIAGEGNLCSWAKRDWNCLKANVSTTASRIAVNDGFGIEIDSEMSFWMNNII